MKKVQKTNDAVFYYNEDSVKKTSTNSGKEFPEKTYNHVCALIQDKPYYTKLLSWHSNKSYSMENLDILYTAEDCLKKHSINLPTSVYLDILSVSMSVYTDSLEYSKKHLPGNIYLMHTDMRSKNLVITRDHQVKLIDLDSFHFIPKFVHWRVPGFLTEIFFLTNQKIQDSKYV